jgi:hypothetical protein
MSTWSVVRPGQERRTGFAAGERLGPTFQFTKGRVVADFDRKTPKPTLPAWGPPSYAYALARGTSTSDS